MPDGVQLHTSADVEQYAAHALAFLEGDAVERNVLLTVIQQARQRWAAWTAPPQFWWMTAGGDVVGAASWTPPFALLVSGMPPEAGAIVAAAALQHARDLAIPLPGVTGPRETSRAVADAIAARTGQRAMEQLRMVVHDLRSLLPVTRPPGGSRRATQREAPLVIEWLRAFAIEAHAPMGGDIDSTVRASIEAGRIWLWVDGEPRSTASQQPAAGGVVRIGAVYTPPSQRGHGYARRLVHDISAAALQIPGVHGCSLSTDAANPVSNAIYGQIGYIPVAEHALFTLVS